MIDAFDKLSIGVIRLINPYPTPGYRININNCPSSHGSAWLVSKKRYCVLRACSWNRIITVEIEYKSYLFNNSAGD